VLPITPRDSFEDANINIFIKIFLNQIKIDIINERYRDDWEKVFLRKVETLSTKA
jgi:hypothetical protein